MKEVFERVKKSWNIIKIVTCLCLILATFYLGYSYFNKVFKNPDVSYGEAFHDMPENSIDILVLGSSHAQYSFVPSFAYQDLGLYSYVLGTPCQPLKVSYEMLKEALKTQNPELLVLEVFTATPQKEACMGDGCYVTAQYQMRGEEKYNTINFLPEDKAETYRNDFINNHNNWRTIESLKDLKYEDQYDVDYSFGYVYMELPMPPDNTWRSRVFNETIAVELADEDLKALNNIYDLCQQKDIEILLYMAPLDSLDVENQSYRYKVWEWAKEREINYVDFVDKGLELDIQNQVHNDGHHSSISGAAFITDYLCNFIKNNYEINNHKNNDMLNIDYSREISDYNLGVLKNEYNAKNYLPRLINSTNTIIVRFNSTDRIVDKSIVNFFYSYGISFDSYNNYYLIIQGGEIVASSNSYIDTDLDGHHFEVLNNKITLDYNEIDNSNSFSLVVFKNDYEFYIAKNIDVTRAWDIGFNEYYIPY